MKYLNFTLKFLLFIAMAVLFLCKEKKDSSIMTVKVKIEPKNNSLTTGEVVFLKLDNKKTKLIAEINGLSPGKHGFHIHEKGDCSSLDGKSAGGHWNPDKKKHGSPDSQEKHAGDLGNLTADESGRAKLEFISTKLKFKGKFSVLGRAVIIHEKEDDSTTQPTGAAGKRVGCGVIKL